jgi:hypothetical protein
MTITTVSLRDFDRDLAHAEKAADHGPVIVKLASPEPRSLLALMDSIPGGEFDFEPLKLGGNDPKCADSSRF